jgi:hypothetical protein
MKKVRDFLNDEADTMTTAEFKFYLQGFDDALDYVAEMHVLIQKGIDPFNERVIMRSDADESRAH